LIYHVINRGNNRQNVFNKPEDFEAFLRSMRMGFGVRHQNTK